MARKLRVHVVCCLLGLAVALALAIAQLIGIWNDDAGYSAVVVAFVAGVNLAVDLLGGRRSSRSSTAVLRRGRVGWVGLAVSSGLSGAMTVFQHLWPLTFGVFWITASSVALALVSETEEDWRYPPRPADKAR